MEERRNGGRKNTNQLITFLKDNNKMALIILAAVVLVVLVLILRSCGGEDGTAGETSGEIIVGEGETAPTRSAEDYALKQDAIPELNELVNTYFEAMKNFDAETYTNIVAGDDMTTEKLQKKGEFIEDYQNISCYTKPGISDGDYVAYVYYEVKFHNVDTLCPALIQLYICTNEDGSMYINAGSLDSELAGYINTVSNDEDVRLLKEETNQKMNEAMAADEKLNLVVQKLNEGASYTEEEETTAAETQPQDISQMTFEDRDEDVLTTTTVRVRSTPTTESDDNIVANIEPNETLHRTGYNEQWSRITYDGEEAYVSSDYVILK